MTGRKPHFDAFAPAKINLYLHVGPPRTDKYHPLDSLAAFASIGDRVRVTPARDVRLSISGPFASALAGEGDNLVLRAASALRTHFQIDPDWGADIALEKNLPIASGVGGGSSDAAAALRALSQLWNIPADEDLSAVARSLGADVPACLAGQPVLMRGVGEHLVPALAPQIGVLLANTGDAMSTPSIYEIFDQMGLGGEFAERPPPEGRQANDFIAALHDYSNDLEAAAFAACPAIALLKDQIAALPGCGLARMSGSGGTVFGLFETPGGAGAAALQLKGARPDIWVEAGTLNPKL